MPFAQGLLMALKDNEGMQGSGYADTIPLDVVRAAPLRKAPSALQAKLHALTGVCISAKDKNANIYTVGKPLGLFMILVCYGNKKDFWCSEDPKLKMGTLSKNY